MLHSAQVYWVYKACQVCPFEEIIVCMQSEDKNDEVTSMQSKNALKCRCITVVSILFLTHTEYNVWVNTKKMAIAMLPTLLMLLTLAFLLKLEANIFPVIEVFAQACNRSDRWNQIWLVKSVLHSLIVNHSCGINKNNLLLALQLI